MYSRPSCCCCHEIRATGCVTTLARGAYGPENHAIASTPPTHAIILSTSTSVPCFSCHWLPHARNWASGGVQLRRGTNASETAHQAAPRAASCATQWTLG